MQELLLPLLTGACGAAIIKVLDNVIMWKLNRKDAGDAKFKALQEGDPA